MSDKVWYKTSNSNGEYYTPFSPIKKKYIAFAPPDSLAKTRDIAKFLNQNSRADYLHDGIAFSRTDDMAEPPVALPAGVYRFEEENYSGLPDRLVPMKLRVDKYVDLGGTFTKVEVDIAKFLANKKLYQEREFAYKMGILLYGPQGQGKSFFLRKIVKDLIPSDSVTVFMRELPSADFLDKVRSNLANELKVFIFEELVTSTSQDRDIDVLLNFLDGENSVANSIILATTNYPEKIPANVINRPSRFDKLYRIDTPSKEEIRTLLTYYFGRESYDSEVECSLGLSVAELKEAALLVMLHELQIGEAVKTLKDRKKLCEKAFAKPLQGVGFGSDY